MKKVFKTILKPFYLIVQGFNYLMNLITRGFYFYLSLLFKFINKLCNNKLYSIENFFRRRENDPDMFSLILVYSFSIIVIVSMLYVPNQKTISFEKLYDDDTKEEVVESQERHDESNDVFTNLYQQYGMTSLKDINIGKLKNTNSDTVLWLMVDKTNINYPIVQTDDNEYYLNHNFLKKYSTDGWTFLDYRNNLNNDRNTIFYGHNLLNKTAFGSISKMFTKNYLNKSNHEIYVIDEKNIYVYKVFSVYYSKPVTDYLQIEFYNEEYLNFLNGLKSKSKFNFNESLSVEDKIITLSTCTDDNSGRKVVHAKQIRVQAR